MNETKKVIIAAAIMVPLSITIMFWSITPVEPTSLQRHSIEIP